MVMAEKKMTEAAVLALVEEEKITASRGAELLGIPLQDFFAIMHANGLTLCDDTPEDIKQDLDDVRKVVKKNAQK
jgi:predicted HTH domain antitoxin